MSGRDDMQPAGEVVSCETAAQACHRSTDTPEEIARPDIDALRQAKSANRKRGGPTRRTRRTAARPSTTPDVMGQSSDPVKD